MPRLGIDDSKADCLRYHDDTRNAGACNFPSFVGNFPTLARAPGAIARRSNMRYMLIPVLLLGAAGAASATDYNFGQIPIPAHGYNSQRLPAMYSDTATFYLGNWIEPDGSEYQYANSATIVFQGEWTYGACSGRVCPPPVLHTTMNQALLMANDGAGNLSPALDVNGNTVTLSYSPVQGRLGKVDRWLTTAALPAGFYTVTGMTGTSCSGRGCQFGGGSYWFSSFSASYNFIPAPPPPPCTDPEGCDGTPD
jgi:hypothetical protein